MHNFLKRGIQVLLVVVYSAIVYLACATFAPDLLIKDTLNLLVLKPAEQPTFEFSGYLTYSEDNAKSWLTALDSFGMVAPNKTFDIFVDSNVDVNTFAKNLSAMSKFCDNFTISVTNNSKLSDSDYVNQCELISKALKDSNIDFKFYVFLNLDCLSKVNLKTFDMSFIDGIGFDIKDNLDLKKYKKTYLNLLSKKDIVVRENIVKTYGEDINKMSAVTHEVYYNLAIAYPEVSKIFSSFVENPYSLKDENSVRGDNPNYFAYQTVYNRILAKGWLSKDTSEVNNISPYVPVVSYDFLPQGTTEVVVENKDQAYVAFKKYKKLYKETPSVLLKVNNTLLTLSSSAPYSASINTDDLPTGINRFTLLIKHGNDNPYLTEYRDLNVEHPVGDRFGTRIQSSGVFPIADGDRFSSNEPFSSGDRSSSSESSPDGDRSSSSESSSGGDRSSSSESSSGGDRSSSNTLFSSGDRSLRMIDTYIPILMYHTVEPTVIPTKENSHVTIEHFDAQLKGLVDAGYTTINFKDLLNYVNGEVTLPDKPVIITMDDGYLNNYQYAFPVYKKYNLQATLFVSPFYMHEENTDRHFGWEAAREMQESGLIDIGSHGYDHTPFSYLTTRDLRYHVSHSIGLIEQHLGKRDVYVLACPQFRINRKAKDYLTSGNWDFIITNLAKENEFFNPPILKRINVPDHMSPKELVNEIETITKK